MKKIAIAYAAALLSATAAAGDPYDYKELVAREVEPAKVAANAAGRSVVDFGKAAVGWLELDGADAGAYEIVIGELVNSRGEVTNEYPRSSIRCQRLSGVKPSGRYRVPMPADAVNLRGYDPKAPAIRLPERFGVVFPFRYAEVVRGPAMTLRQLAVNYPIDMRKSRFSCDCADLVRVYDFCKYSILATSFCGVYVDGDRERTPYEADAYINQLSHYAIDDDCSLARKSHEWLMDHPTWPTEWKQHSIMMAWADWMWTGDTRSLAKCYDRLVGEKLLLGFARASDGLLETGGERNKGAKPGAGDIVDWPAAERDGFDFRPVNAVVNAFFYRNLREMADISRALGKEGRAAEFSAMAQNVYNAFQRAFYRPEAGLYADGEGSGHCSLHANAIALAFGLVPKERVSAVADFVEGKGMACSVYFAQYLLEALFEAGRADAAVRLMASRDDRSWIGMIDFGSTVSMEAWNVSAKPNLDLTHAWSTAPLNVISRYVVGVTPLEPGFRRVSIRPRLGGLKRLSATVPTAAGPVTVEVDDGVLQFRSPVPAEVVFPGKVRDLGAVAVSLQAATVERVFRPERHSRGDTNVRVQQPIDEASWIWAKGCDVWGGAVFSETRTTPEVLAKMPQSFFRFRKDFSATEEPLEFDVSADERFVLLLDGKEVARGPMRGLPNRWNYQSYRVSGLEPGMHRLEAVCWQVGEHAPLAQVSVRGGFIVKAGGAYDAQLTTGKAAWRVAPLVGTRMTHKGKSGAFGVGSQCEVRGTGLVDEEPAAGAWSEAVVVRGPVKTWAGLVVQGWKLFPSPLRDMMRELKTPGEVKRGFDALKRGAVVPANTKVTAWWDLGDYYCAYPALSVSGGKGARICWDWAECLTGPDGKKGDRVAFEGLDIPRPFGDVFLCDGRAGARFTTPWWRCGRWCRLTVETKDEPLTLDGVEIAETRYPVEMAASFECDDEFVMKMQPVCARSLQMCMHEMFFDCPYYEQQMYPGDSRLQYLVSGLFDTEDRMVRNAINLYDADRRDNGQIPMNCPTRGTQDALGFTCCEAMMFGDYAWNHANREWLRAKMPGLNHTLMGMDEFAREDGLLRKTPGWNFVDWAASPWKSGVPPDGDSERPNAEMNLQYLHAMLSAATAEDAVGDHTLAAYWRGRADRLKAAIKAAFWCEDKSLFSSNVGKTEFSEHSQCLALLADVVTGEEAGRCFKALVETPDLVRGTIYYKHYLFSTYFKFRRADLFFGNLGFWRNCLGWHLSTILETPGIDSRSDCHGWGSHPLWHLHTGVAGVKSAAPFYERVIVEPQPAHLKRIRSSTPTPKGDVRLDLSFDGGKASGTVSLPSGLSGVFRWNGKDIPLAAGSNGITE